MIKFPSIGQFRAAVKYVRLRAAYVGSDELGNPIYNKTLSAPTLDYVGTVKLHGTNSSIIQEELDGELVIQSRNRRLTVENDNFRFAYFVTETIGEEFFKNFFAALRSQFKLNNDDVISVYGEWCGEGIQKGVAISKLSKMFVIFAIRLHKDEDTIWITPEQMKSIPQPIYDNPAIKMIFDFPHYEITIDFENASLSQNRLIALTKDVEEDCPVGKALGSPGIGEGIVWRCITSGYEDSRFWFKVKGEKHSVTKVKTLASVDVKKVNSIHEFAGAVLSEARFMQGIEYLKEMNKELSKKSTGDYIRWIINDVKKEESDMLDASELTFEDVKKHLSASARKRYFSWLNFRY